jgi:hypothetical protein
MKSQRQVDTKWQSTDRKITMARWGTCLLILAGWALLLASPVLGQTPDDQPTNSDTGYTLTWWTVDGGGGNLVGSGDYTLSSTAGQHDAEVIVEGEYTLSGGFWAGGGLEPTYYIHLPIIARSSP